MDTRNTQQDYASPFAANDDLIDIELHPEPTNISTALAVQLSAVEIAINSINQQIPHLNAIFDQHDETIHPNVRRQNIASGLKALTALDFLADLIIYICYKAVSNENPHLNNLGNASTALFYVGLALLYTTLLMNKPLQDHGLFWLKLTGHLSEQDMAKYQALTTSVENLNHSLAEIYGNEGLLQLVYSTLDNIKKQAEDTFNSSISSSRTTFDLASKTMTQATIFVKKTRGYQPTMFSSVAASSTNQVEEVSSASNEASPLLRMGSRSDDIV